MTTWDGAGEHSGSGSASATAMRPVCMYTGVPVHMHTPQALGMARSLGANGAARLGQAAVSGGGAARREDGFGDGAKNRRTGLGQSEGTWWRRDDIMPREPAMTPDSSVRERIGPWENEVLGEAKLLAKMGMGAPETKRSP